LFLAANISSVFELDAGRLQDKTILDLSDAKAGVLFNKRTCWPHKGNLKIHGFEYNLIDERAERSTQADIEWLRLQPRDHLPAQPYEQMATVLRNMGLQEEAANVEIAKNDDFGARLDRRR